MTSTIGVYESHDKAFAAVKALKELGFPDKQLSVVGKADLAEGHVQVKSEDAAGKTHLSIGVASVAVLEVLSVVGIFVVPGLGLLFGAGAIVGLFAGLDVALLAGGDVKAIFTNKAIHDQQAIKYEQDLLAGKFLVFADGNDEQIKQAQQVLLS